VTQTYLNQQATTAPFASREASAAGRLRPNAVTGEVAVQSSHSDVKQRSSVYEGTGMPSLFSRFNGSLLESFDRSPLDRRADNERGAKTHAFSDK
jgi:hypothetical protein